jgi:peptidoglycan hydrolase-like protein with peptidoglycan-binding domain
MKSTHVSSSNKSQLLGLNDVGDRTLRLAKPYMKGEDVRFVQKVVGAEPDGVYGPNTKQAVQTYQRKKGFNPADGSVGPALWEKVKNDAGWFANLKNDLDFLSWATEGTEYGSGSEGSAESSSSNFLDTFDEDFFDWYGDKPSSTEPTDSKEAKNQQKDNTWKWLAGGSAVVITVGALLAVAGNDSK